MVVITSHIKALYNTYQLLTKMNIQKNKQIQQKRAKIKNLDDKLIYALYTLFPARRLEWKLVIMRMI